jgi:hypothetical protein
MSGMPLSPDDRAMLALAALTYRGFTSQTEHGVGVGLRARLAQLEADGLGRWSLVWGPEVFRMPGSFVHDALAYVAREEAPAGVPPRYVVAIRGTNPVSLSDWFFGDFWVSQLLPWPGAEPHEAKLSGSTRFGLEIVRRLGGSGLPASVDLGLFDLPLGSGATLRTFFAALPKGARVVVTGHSKGGALAVATALWLHEELAESRNLTLECFSFAGPMAGNLAFVRRYDAALAARTRRIVNPLDVVPHAWDAGELRRMADFYPHLALALEALAITVEPLEYRHVGGTLVELPSRPAEPDPHRKIVEQHLDAYLGAARLPPERWSAGSIFSD